MTAPDELPLDEWLEQMDKRCSAEMQRALREIRSLQARVSELEAQVPGIALDEVQEFTVRLDAEHVDEDMTELEKRMFKP